VVLLSIFWTDIPPLGQGCGPDPTGAYQFMANTNVT